MIFSSSTQAVQENPYGRSKRAAEEVAVAPCRGDRGGGLCVSAAECLRQVVPAELQLGGGHFCHNIARGLPIRVDDPAEPLSLVYVDDVVDEFIRVLQEQPPVDGEAVCAVPVDVRRDGGGTGQPSWRRFATAALRWCRSGSGRA